MVLQLTNSAILLLRKLVEDEDVVHQKLDRILPGQHPSEDTDTTVIVSSTEKKVRENAVCAKGKGITEDCQGSDM